MNEVNKVARKCENNKQLNDGALILKLFYDYTSMSSITLEL